MQKITSGDLNAPASSASELLTNPELAAVYSQEKLIIVPARSYGTTTAAVFLLILAGLFLFAIAGNPHFGWSTIGKYLFYPAVLRGLGLTLWLTAVTMIIGIVLGTVVALMSMAENPVLVWVSRIFIWFFRGTPVLVQLTIWYNLAALFPTLSIGIPFGPTFLSADTNDVITPYAAAILGLGLNEGAYMAEIVRAGLQSVDQGQRRAAKALGMANGLAMWRIVLPQAMVFIIPPTGNETIGMLKTTSLVSVIALSDLLYSVQAIYSRNFETIPLLLVACAWYLVATSILSLIQGRIERRFSRGIRSGARRWWR